MNSANYFLTKDGVISKLDSYWDQLREHSARLDSLSKPMLRKLFNSFIGSVLIIITLVWLNFEKEVTMILLSLTALGSVSISTSQLLVYLEFLATRKRGLILHDELNTELECSYDDEFDEDISVEERILLSNFQLSCEPPMHPGLYLILLTIYPILNIAFALSYYFYL